MRRLVEREAENDVGRGTRKDEPFDSWVWVSAKEDHRHAVKDVLESIRMYEGIAERTKRLFGQHRSVAAHVADMLKTASDQTSRWQALADDFFVMEMGLEKEGVYEPVEEP